MRKVYQSLSSLEVLHLIGVYFILCVSHFSLFFYKYSHCLISTSKVSSSLGSQPSFGCSLPRPLPNTYEFISRYSRHQLPVVLYLHAKVSK